MKLYYLKHSGDVKVVGASPQLQFSNSRNPDYNIHADYSASRISSARNVSDNIRLPTLETTPHCKVTDYMSYSGAGSSELMIFRNTIELNPSTIKIDKFEQRRIQVFHKQKLLNFIAVHFIQSRDIINWENSLFAIVRKDDYIFEGQKQIWNELKEIKFDNEEEYWKWRRSQKEQNVTLVKKHLSIANIKWSLFRSPSPLYGYLCTENFIKYTEEKKITGITFEKVKLDFRDTIVETKSKDIEL